MPGEKPLAEIFDEIQGSVDEVQDFSDWHPPTGNYECLLAKFEEGKSTDDANDVWPWFRVTMKILDAEDKGLERDEIKLFCPTNPASASRPYRFKEMEALAYACGGQKLKIGDAVKAVRKLADKQETLLNVNVRARKAKNGQTYTNYVYRAANSKPAT